MSARSSVVEPTSLGLVPPPSTVSLSARDSRGPDGRLQEALEKVEKLQAQMADLKPLAEAAAEHRQEASKQKRRAEEAERAPKAPQHRIADLEQELSDAQSKIASLESDLVAYEKLGQKVKAAGDLFDLLDPWHS
jgi:predicted RNase H-like nuclease (RuvC/YqgF family)